MFDSDRLSDARSDARERRRVIAAFAALSLAAVAITIATTLLAGINWDDGIELYVAHDEPALLHHGAADYSAASSSILSTGAWYGVVPGAIAHLIAWAPGLEPGWDVATTASAYAVRHGVALGFGLLCVASLALTVWRLTRRTVAVVVLPAVLLALPTFGGHAAINIKDVPVACGLTGVACGLALVMRNVQRGGGWVLANVLIGVGTFVAVGTRGGSVALVAALGGLAGIAALAVYGRAAAVQLARSAGAVVLAIVCVVAANPVAQYGPLRWLIDCVRLASAFPGWDGFILVAGRFVRSTALPWWYVPAWLLVQTPLSFVALAAVAIERPRRTQLVWLPFIALGVVMPVLVVLSGATLYNALRHLLFMLPPFALLAAFGADRLARTRPWLAVGLVALLVGECALWVPYQYAYLNPIGMALGGAKAFEGDYWGISGREGARRLHKAGATRIIVGPGPTGLPYGGGTELGDVPEFDGFYVFGEFGVFHLVKFPTTPSGCQRQFVVARVGVRLGEGFICDPPVSIGAATPH